MTYNLGIDIGIASVGFAGVDLEKHSILFCGAHIFDAAENPKDGASLATPRREKRGLRRVIGRRAARKKAIRALLAQHGFQDIEAIDLSKRHKKTGKGNLPINPWDLRKEALERKQIDAELVRVLFHIAKHRGFQSNRKGAEPNDLEGKKALNGAKELQEAMIQTKAPTVGAYLATLPKKRNGDGLYERFVTRDLLREEIKKIFEAQRRLGNGKVTEKLQVEYEEAAFFQRPLQSSEGLVGWCTFEEGEKRAPRFSYTAELFILWSKLNSTKICDMKRNERFLNQDEKNRLAVLVHKNSGGVSYKQARVELAMSNDERFNIGYRKIKDEDNSWEKIRDATEKSPGNFLKLPGYHALKSALDTGSTADWQAWIGPDRDRLDEIARILSFYEDPQQIDDLLAKLRLDEDQRRKLAAITNFSRTIDLSLKALRIGKGKGGILEHLIKGQMEDGQPMTYDKACKTAGYDHSRKQNKGLDKVLPFDDIRNPVVNRSMAQTRKVINACIRKYGMPGTIIVELAREVGKPFKDRKDIEREQKKNQAHREEAKAHVAEILGMNPDDVRGDLILKYRLWYKEQGKDCFYCGTQITTEEFIDPTATQIDHIIPYRRSWNDSYMNKTLCHTRCNQEKKDKTPYEWLSGTKRWDGLVVESKRLPLKKAENLLTENFDEDKANKWKDRALNDTRYMARLLKNHLEQTLALGEGNRVQTRNGSLTANLRGAWGFPDKNRRNDRHHAVDAIVLACSTQSQVKQFADWNKYDARRKNPAERSLPQKPWDTFRDDVMNAVYGPKNERGVRIGGIFVSRMPVRKITGAAHQETIRSIRTLPDGERQIVQRVKLSNLSPATLANLVDKERNIKLYNVLKNRLDAHDGKADKAFAAPVYMPTNDLSKQGPRINSVRIVTNEKSGITINEGLASNGDQIRIDIFLKKGKYFAVPIYVHHFTKDKLPGKAVVAHTDEDNWEVMDDNDFLFSLYKNDLVRIQSKTEDYFAYYAGTIDRSTGAISVRAHDRDPSFGKKTTDGTDRTGIKTLLAFEKYSVDYFGNKHRIKKELRLGLAHRDDPESGET